MDKIFVIDFGGQYSHLISRRIRDLGVYSEVMPPDITVGDLKEEKGLKGVVLSGGAASVYDPSSPKYDSDILNLGVPLLGICYGHQLLAYLSGGKVIKAEYGEYGLTDLKILKESKLLRGLRGQERVWMNHKDIVESLPKDYVVVASTENSPIGVFENYKKKVYGVQFHPEVSHTICGSRILQNFAFEICHARTDWNIPEIIEKITEEIRQTVGDRKAIIGLSGGVDSSTATVLVNRAIGENLTAVYVDSGLMRFKETEFVRDTFSRFEMKLRIIDAHERFLKALEGISQPEEKRKIIGRLFIEIFDEIAQMEEAKVLIQGTIYSDRIESGITQHSCKIKSHHNVGGLPARMRLDLYEPLKDLYKDEVRKIARELGLPDSIIDRHIFPGPGLAVRIIGEVTPEKVEIVRKASFIIEEELKNFNLYNKLWMAFAVLLPIKSVGIQGDARSYKYPIVVRIVESKDAMTANFARIPYDVLERISTRITNEINEVNRVVYDISNKPPATMEWE